jgi:hypothetical protein
MLNFSRFRFVFQPLPCQFLLLYLLNVAVFPAEGLAIKEKF